MKACNLGPVGWAVVERSLPHLQTAIKANPLAVYEAVGRAHVIQLCIFVDWHDGLRILLAILKETAEGLDYIFKIALWFALYRVWKTHRHRSLLDHNRTNCNMAHIIRLILDTGCRVPNYTAIFTKFPCIRMMITEHLQNRREQLKALALKHMTFAQAEYFQLHRPSRCVDTRATEIVQQLEKADVQVPQTLYPNNTSPSEIKADRSVWQTIAKQYDNPSFSPHFGRKKTPLAWQCFYDAGFTEIDENCSEPLYRTPIIGMGNIPHSAMFRLWLLDKGVDLSKPFPIQLLEGSSQASYIEIATAAHKIAHDYSEFGIFDRGPSKWDMSLIQRLLSADAPPDCCSCACSLDGCTPLSCLLIGSPPELESEGLKLPTIDQASASKSCKHILKWLGPHVQIQGKAATAALIRALCFNTLELRHTCCKNIFSKGADWKTAKEFREEMDMIRDEDEKLLQEFEDLVQDLVQSFDQSGQNIYQYVLGPLLWRVWQVKREWESPDPEFYDRQLSCARLENWDRNVYPESRVSGPQLDTKGPQYDLDRSEDQSLWLAKRLEDIFDNTKPLKELDAAMRSDCLCSNRVWERNVLINYISYDSEDSEKTDVDGNESD